MGSEIIFQNSGARPGAKLRIVTTIGQRADDRVRQTGRSRRIPGREMAVDALDQPLRNAADGEGYCRNSPTPHLKPRPSKGFGPQTRHHQQIGLAGGRRQVAARQPSARERANTHYPHRMGYEGPERPPNVQLQNRRRSAMKSSARYARRIPVEYIRGAYAHSRSRSLNSGGVFRDGVLRANIVSR